MNKEEIRVIINNHKVRYSETFDIITMLQSKNKDTNKQIEKWEKRLLELG